MIKGIIIIISILIYIILMVYLFLGYSFSIYILTLLFFLVIIYIFFNKFYKKDDLLKKKDDLQNLKNILDEKIEKIYLSNKYIKNIEKIDIQDLITKLSTFNSTLSIYENFILKKNIDKYIKNTEKKYTDIINNNRKLYIRTNTKRFSKLFNNIEEYPLDKEQITSILIPEKKHLVIAGAGSGKTTTIIGKIKFLLDRGIPGESILCISYTDKAVKEMKNRIEDKIGNKNIHIKTFHRLGNDIIANYNQKNNRKKQNILGENIKYKFKKQINTKLIEYFNKKGGKSFYKFYNFFLKYNYKDISEFNSYYEYKTYLKNSGYNFIKGDIDLISNNGEKLKSMEEVEIANFLFLNGIKYKYEEPYKYDVSSSEYSQYKPDFYLTEYDIYIEHFGINKEGNVPQFFGDTYLNYNEANLKYKEGIKWKEKIHRIKNTKLIKTYSYEKRDGNLFYNLESKLKNNNVKFKQLSNEDLKDILSSKMKIEYDNFLKLLFTFLDLYKSSGYEIYNIKENIGNLFKDQKDIERTKMFIDIFELIVIEYNDFLIKNNSIDFNDMINISSKYIKEGDVLLNYKYILIDEYQDIGRSRFNLLNSILNTTKAWLFAVGDDWQSIYRFSGSSLDFFVNFKKYFKDGEISFINNTYRYPQKVNEITKEFIMKNKNQINKTLKSGNHNNSEDVYEIVSYKKDVEQISIINNIIKKIPKNKSILLLGRTNHNNILDELDIEYKRNCKFLTIHKSKGLEADFIILLNVVDSKMGFPIKIVDDDVLKLVLSKEDNFLYGEERRLFYVALTRAKEKTYILTNKYKESIFIKEFITYLDKKSLKNYYLSEDNIPKEYCPRCKNGIIEYIKNSKKGIYACRRYPLCNFSYYKNITFGKYKGKKYSDIDKKDPKYIEWIISNYSGKNREIIINSIYYTRTK